MAIIPNWFEYWSNAKSNIIYCDTCIGLCQLLHMPIHACCKECTKHAISERKRAKMEWHALRPIDPVKIERANIAMERYKHDKAIADKALADATILANKRAKARRKIIRNRATRRLALRMFYKRIGLKNWPI